MSNSFIYTDEHLSIRVKTKNAAQEHYNLLQGINLAIQYYISNPEKTPDVEGLLSLMNLQKTLLPTPMDLQTAYEADRNLG